MQVTVDGLRLWFDVDGVGLAADGDAMVERRTVIALHGGPGFDHSYLKPELQSLAQVAQVIFLDQRGQGRSEAGDPADWRLDRWADDVAALCRTLGIRRPILLGHSFGGFVALAAAARHPDLASGLIVLSSAAHVEREAVVRRFGELGGAAAADAAAKMFRQPDDPSSLAAFMRHCMPLYACKDPAAMAAKFARCIQSSGPQNRFFAPDGEFGSFDYRPGLRTCHAPTLMLHGAMDPIVPAAFAEDTASCFPAATAELVVYDDSSHDIIGDRWPDVHAAMRAFIERSGLGS